MRQHAKNNASESLRRELLQKNEMIRAIELQVKELSTHSETRDAQVKESKNKNQQLLVALRTEQEQLHAARLQVKEAEERHTVATGLVRSLKAELVRMERRGKDLEEEASANLILSKRLNARHQELEIKLSKKEKESQSFRKKAKQATTILQQLGNLTNSP